nr:DUF4249 domain-containing protein [uncultured Dyadobacter sp.]
MKSRYFFSLMIVILMASCETLVTNIPEARLPKTDSKLVVHSFISPQNPWIDVSVSESSPLFSKSKATNSIIENTEVKISDGTKEVILPFDTKSQTYRVDQAKFKIEASKTYWLVVSDGTREVKASCTVPKNTPVIKSYVLDTIVTNNSFFGQDTVITLKMDWQDIPADTNYYKVWAMAEVEYSIPDPQTKEKRTRDGFNFTWDDMNGHSELQSDRNMDGSLFSSPRGKVTMPNFNPPQPGAPAAVPFYPRSRIIFVTMLLYNTDIHYFKYHQSLQSQIGTDNPFTEPAMIYGNIQGGLGCFAAYNTGKLIYQPD